MSEQDLVPAPSRRQTLLAGFGEFARAQEDPDPILAETCRVATEALDSCRCTVLALEDQDRRLLVRAGAGMGSDMAKHLRDALPGPFAAFLQTGAIRVPGGTAVAVPVVLPSQRPYGLLHLDGVGDLSQEDVAFLRTCCAILGAALGRLSGPAAGPRPDERFRLTLEAVTDYAIFLSDPQDRITDWLPGAEAVLGWTAAEMAGQPGAAVFPPEDRAAGQPEAEITAALGEGHVFLARPHLRRDGRRVLIEGTVRALFDESHRHLGFIRIGRDVTQRRKTNEQLRTLMNGIPQLVWRSRPLGEWTWASQQWLSFTGQSLDEARGLGWLEAVHPEDRDRVMQDWRGAREAGILDTEFRVRRAADGAYLWHHTRSRPVHDQQGGVTEWLGTSTDVQDLKELQERQAVLVAELQHRTRNLIGVVRSIATQTMASTGPTQVFLDRFTDRLSALSRVQGLLSRAEHEPITLRALLQLELDALGVEDGGQVVLDGPSVRIRPGLVQTLALGLHELATNARKYGALSGTGGQLTVTWSLTGPREARRLLIEWRETGIEPTPAPSGALTGGYGRRLIEEALPYNLGAQTAYHLGPDQLVCTIDLPLVQAAKTQEV